MTSKAQILVVEDESIVALDIQNRLMGLGYTISASAASGAEAIRKAANRRPDLVLMDIKLRGEMDGVEAAERIRARFDIPVVYLTAYADGATLQRAKLSEPFGYVLKPFEERELHTAIEMALYRHKMERKLKESERWLATTLQSIGDAVLATDAQGRVRFMNARAEALTGWKREDAAGRDARHVFRVINADTRSSYENPVTKVLQSGIGVELESDSLLVAKDGKETLVYDSAAPIKDDQGCISGVVLVFRDITKRVRAERKLRRIAAELQTRNEELDAFSHSVAHDLKGPVSSIVGFAEVLQEDYGTMSEDDLRHYLRMIARSGRKMGNIIDELLLLATVPKMEIETRPLDMAGIVAETQERLAYMIRECGADIILPDAWPAAWGYGPWIEEVWVNYLSNAIKYGGQPPRVELGATVADGSDKTAPALPETPCSTNGAAKEHGIICFWIRDNGAGLTPEEQARLFTPLTQLAHVRATGHGLGLSIVRRIVEKLGGQVGVASKAGHGSVFTFTLPAGPPSG
jgi:PAS domain S-box-containing protein